MHVLGVLNGITIAQASSPAEIASIRELFLEYAASLEISLCFQHFEEELASLPGKYAPPLGLLLLARGGTESVACGALRPLEQGVCEMKRLFIRPTWRGKGLGRLLGEKIIQAAAEIGYQRMRLDTLDSMKPAIALYESLGFRRIPPYYSNPSERAVFMELELKGALSGEHKQTGSVAG